MTSQIMSMIRNMSSHQGERRVTQGVGDWIVDMTWPEGVEDGGPATLTIQPIGDLPVGGLSSTVLRTIDFRKAIDSLRSQISNDGVRTRQHEAVREWRASRLRSALIPGVTDDYLALLSAEYVQAVDRGQANVNDYLAEVVGKPLSTFRGHLGQARKRGFLTGSPGRKGGKLEPKAEKIVERIEAETADSYFEMLEKSRETQPPKTVRVKT